MPVRKCREAFLSDINKYVQVRKTDDTSRLLRKVNTYTPQSLTLAAARTDAQRYF